IQEQIALHGYQQGAAVAGPFDALLVNTPVAPREALGFRNRRGCALQVFHLEELAVVLLRRIVKHDAAMIVMDEARAVWRPNRRAAAVAAMRLVHDDVER